MLGICRVQGQVYALFYAVLYKGREPPGVLEPIPRGCRGMAADESYTRFLTVQRLNTLGPHIVQG